VVLRYIRRSIPWLAKPARLTWLGRPGCLKKTTLVQVDFITATTLRSERTDILLLIPIHVCCRPWQRWNTPAHEPYHINPISLEFSNDCLLVSELAGINTGCWTFAYGMRGSAMDSPT
jgi:hypothetical protein